MSTDQFGLEIYGPDQEKSRAKLPSINSFRTFATNELLRRKNEFPTPITTPFVRMTSCLEVGPLVQQGSEVSNYRYFNLGLHGVPSTGEFDNTFGLTYGGDKEYVGYAYSRNDDGSSGEVRVDISQIEVGNFFRNGKNTNPNQRSVYLTQEEQAQKLQGPLIADGKLPMPGVVSVNLERFTDGAGILARVTWKCYGTQQLEFLRHFFMTVGTHVVIEYGNNFSNIGQNGLPETYPRLDFTSDGIDEELSECLIKGRRYIIEKYVSSANGNYDFLIGSIGNFTVAMDSNTNCYTITTSIYGSGESLWGLNNYNTVSDVAFGNSNRKDLLFESFFKPGGNFDKFIKESESSDRLYGDNTRSIVQADHRLDKEGETWAKQDNWFVSWRFFTENLMYELFNMLDQEIAKSPTDNNQIFEDIQRDLISFMRPTEDEKTNIPNEPESMVGYNPFLFSTDPESLIIVNKVGVKGENGRRRFNGSALEQASGGVATRGNKIDFTVERFGNLNFTGKLDVGVYITVKLIREAFLQNKSVPHAIKHILTRMNAATCGYWSLQLIFNQDRDRYEIVDRKYADKNVNKYITGEKPIYKFNAGNLGECLSIDFDAAFPPEAVTQMMLMAKFKADPNLYAEALKRYPMIGVEHLYAMALNWSNTKDILSPLVRAKKQIIRPTNPFVFTAQPEPVDLNTNIGPIAASTAVTGTNKLQKNILPKVSSEEVSPAAEAPSPSPKDVAIVDQRLMKYEDYFQKYGRLLEARVSGLDGAALLKSIAQNESSGIVNATGVSGNDYGLLQINGVHRPKNQSKQDFINDMFNPEKNIAKATQLLLNNLTSLARVSRSTSSGAVYMENWIISHKTGAGLGIKYSETGRYIDPTSFAYFKRIASAYTQRVSQKQTATQIESLFRNPIIGSGPLPTRSYTSEYLKAQGKPYLQYYDVSSATPKLKGGGSITPEAPVSTPTSAPVPNTSGIFKQPAQGLSDIKEQFPATPTEKAFQDNAEKQKAEELQVIEQYKEKFGYDLLIFIQLNKAKMMRDIINHGATNHETTSNNFIAPVPINVNVRLTIKGIGGFSLFDGFKVDKLPYIYEKYGVFQITKMRDVISSTGWITELDGIYRFMYLDGTADLIPTIY